VTPDRVFPRVTLPTERLILRPFVPGDAADVHAVWTDEVYLRFAPAQFAHAGASLDRAVEWCARTADQQRQAGKGIALAGAERDTGRLACHVALFGTDWTAMITEIHYWTAAWARAAAWSRAGRGDMAVYSLIPNDLGDAGNP
jgi:RimJ/RimL family protein N-acetyltransferase